MSTNTEDATPTPPPPSPTPFESFASELWAEVLKKLLTPSDVCSARATCVVWRTACHDHEDAIWDAVCKSPRLAPYILGGFSGRLPPPRDLCGKDRCKAAISNRRCWASRRTLLQRIVFPSYVRCVKVDWKSNLFAAGLYDGRVFIVSLHDDEARDHANLRPAGDGHHVDEVLALDIAGSFLLSTSGQPSYYDQPATTSTLRIISVESSPFEDLCELGARHGGHTDSINAVKVVAYASDGANHSCTAVTASSDSTLIVWDICAQKAIRTMRASAALRALETVSDTSTSDAASAAATTLLSCSLDGRVTEWDWQRGLKLRTILEGLPPLSAMSFHASSSTIALGDQCGAISLYRLNPYRVRVGSASSAAGSASSSASARPPSGSGVDLAHEDQQLMAYILAGPYGNRPVAPRAKLEVATVKHDADKLVYAARTGQLRVIRFDELPDEGCPFGIYTDGRSVRKDDLAASALDGAWRRQAGLRKIEQLKACDCRMYVSSVDYQGGVLIADGFDNVVVVMTMQDDEDSGEGGARHRARDLRDQTTHSCAADPLQRDDEDDEDDEDDDEDD